MITLIRKPEASDVGLVLSSWLKSARKMGSCAHMTNKIYYTNESIRIKALLSKSIVAVICNPDDPVQVYGWCAYNKVGDLLIVHYCYVKLAFRRMGIMREFISSIYPRFTKDEVAITHVSERVLPLRQKLRLVYNPYLQEI